MLVCSSIPFPEKGPLLNSDVPKLFLYPYRMWLTKPGETEEAVETGSEGWLPTLWLLSMLQPWQGDWQCVTEMVHGWTTKKERRSSSLQSCRKLEGVHYDIPRLGIRLYCSVSQDVRGHYSSMLLHSERKIGKCNHWRNGSLSVSHTSKLSSAPSVLLFHFVSPGAMKTLQCIQ